MKMTKYEPGSFNWVDYAATDLGAAKAFYGEVLNWSIKDHDAGEAGIYSMAYLDEKPVAALYEMRKQMALQGVPSHWVSYVSVADVDATTSRVEALGGKVIMPPFDVMQEGRMAVIQDPAGATFSIWQPRQHFGAHLRGDPNTVCWNELMTPSYDAVQAFYTKLFGWTASRENMPSGADMVMFKLGEQYAASMMKITEEMGPLPPNWMVYFAVSDCDETIERVKRSGGEVVVPPTTIPPVGTFATLKDPLSGFFSVIKLDNPPS